MRNGVSGLPGGQGSPEEGYGEGGVATQQPRHYPRCAEPAEGALPVNE